MSRAACVGLSAPGIVPRTGTVELWVKPNWHEKFEAGRGIVTELGATAHVHKVQNPCGRTTLVPAAAGPPVEARSRSVGAEWREAGPRRPIAVGLLAPGRLEGIRESLTGERRR